MGVCFPATTAVYCCGPRRSSPIKWTQTSRPPLYLVLGDSVKDVFRFGNGYFVCCTKYLVRCIRFVRLGMPIYLSVFCWLPSLNIRWRACRLTWFTVCVAKLFLPGPLAAIIACLSVVATPVYGFCLAPSTSEAWKAVDRSLWCAPMLLGCDYVIDGEQPVLSRRVGTTPRAIYLQREGRPVEDAVPLPVTPIDRTRLAKTPVLFASQLSTLLLVVRWCGFVVAGTAECRL